MRQRDKNKRNHSVGCIPCLQLFHQLCILLGIVREEAGGRNVNGRRKVENEERKGDRTAGKEAEEWNGECEAGGRRGRAGKRGKTLFPLKGGRHFSPRARWLSCVFCSGVVAA